MDSARSIEIDRSVVQDMMSCSVATMRRKLFLVGREDRQPCSQLQMLYTVYFHLQDFPPTTNISWTGEHMGEMVDQDHYIGQRLSLKSQTCTVRFIGAVKDKQGQWLGVEWDDASRGKHDGTHEGISYFTCMCHAQIPFVIRHTDPDAHPQAEALRRPQHLFYGQTKHGTKHAPSSKH